MDAATNYSAAPGNRRGTSSRTGQNTRARLRAWALFLYGPWCAHCRQGIDLELSYPDPWSYSTDHIRMQRDGGLHLFCNVQPSHLICNSRHGGGKRGRR